MERLKFLPDVVQSVGGREACLLLSFLLWHDGARTEDIREALYLSEEEIEKAKKKLREKGLLIEEGGRLFVCLQGVAQIFMEGNRDE